MWDADEQATARKKIGKLAFYKLPSSTRLISFRFRADYTRDCHSGATAG
jgi:hypothetical protein